LALAYILAHPRPHVATVFVSPPSLMGSQFGTYEAAGGVSQFPIDFVASATSPAVENTVARQTHVSVGDLQSGLSVTQVDLSSRVDVTYTTRDPSTANPVAVAVARQTLLNMFASQVPMAQNAVRSATASLHAANQAIADFNQQHGSLPVDQQYKTLTDQISALENEKASDESRGLTWSASRLGDQIDQLRTHAAALAPLSSDQADLLAKQAAASSTLTTSQLVLAQAQAQRAAADPREVNAPPAQEVPLTHLVVTMVLPAVAVGVFLAIVLVALLELVAQRRPQTVRGRRPIAVQGRRLIGGMRSALDTLRLVCMMVTDRARAVGEDSGNAAAKGPGPEPIPQEAESR
jgi:uncharacterized protein involved in exopolysaccharide biosynthesis